MADVKPMIAFLLSVCGAWAHPVSQMAVRADIRTNRVDVLMQVKAEDLVWFHKLTNQTEVTVTAEKLRGAAARHRGFLLKYFHVLDSRGQALTGKIEGHDDSVIGAGLNTAQLTTAEISYRLSFEFAGPEPWLTFMQDFGGDDASVPALMELDVHHLGVRLDQPVNLPGNAPRWVRLDWANGPPAPPRSLAEIRQRKKERQQRKLGLVDDLGVYSFLHIGQTNVRHELLMPLWKWRTWPKPVHTNSIVRINGRQVAGSLDRSSLHPPTTSDFGSIEPSPVDESHARIAVVLNYRADAPLKELQIEWHAFSKAIPFLKSMILVPGQRPTQTFFTNERRLFVWRRKPGSGVIFTGESHWGHRHEGARIIVHEIKTRGIIRALQK